MQALAFCLYYNMYKITDIKSIQALIIIIPIFLMRELNNGLFGVLNKIEIALIEFPPVILSVQEPVNGLI